MTKSTSTLLINIGKTQNRQTQWTICSVECRQINSYQILIARRFYVAQTHTMARAFVTAAVANNKTWLKKIERAIGQRSKSTIRLKCQREPYSVSPLCDFITWQRIWEFIKMNCNTTCTRAPTVLSDGDQWNATEMGARMHGIGR